MVDIGLDVTARHKGDVVRKDFTRSDRTVDGNALGDNFAAHLSVAPNGDFTSIDLAGDLAINTQLPVHDDLDVGPAQL
ncbi:MAG: hypothetical protein R3D67_19865 [Hyphomicrobiaceae bacterium]